MRNIQAGAVGGIVAGLIVSGVMAFGRDAGLLQKTLAESAQDWLDRAFNTRQWAGQAGTEALEQAHHLAASAAFGAAYGLVRPLTRPLAPVAAGALFGAGLYAVAIARIAPKIGLTREAAEEPPGVPAQRLAMHVLFGVVAAVVTDALAPPRRRRETIALDRRAGAAD